jgi:hypothetical protein
METGEVRELGRRCAGTAAMSSVESMLCKLGKKDGTRELTAEADWMGLYPCVAPVYVIDADSCAMRSKHAGQNVDDLRKQASGPVRNSTVEEHALAVASETWVISSGLDMCELVLVVLRRGRACCDDPEPVTIASQCDAIGKLVLV